MEVLEAAATAGAPKERRSTPRQRVDASARIFLVRSGQEVGGRILDLSLGGCHIRTERAFPGGVYARVETEFQLQGLPFRLGGVVQRFHDRDQLDVGIRFLDVSDRKRRQVEELIAEIRQTTVQADSASPCISLPSASCHPERSAAQ